MDKATHNEDALAAFADYVNRHWDRGYFNAMPYRQRKDVEEAFIAGYREGRNDQ